MDSVGDKDRGLSSLALKPFCSPLITRGSHMRTSARGSALFGFCHRRRLLFVGFYSPAEIIRFQGFSYISPKYKGK